MLNVIKGRSKGLTAPLCSLLCQFCKQQICMVHSLVNHFEYSKEACQSSRYCGQTMRLDGSEYELHQRQETCLSSKTSKSAMETMQLLNQWVPGFFPQKLTTRLHLMLRLKKEWGYTSTPPIMPLRCGHGHLYLFVCLFGGLTIKKACHMSCSPIYLCYWI